MMFITTLPQEAVTIREYVEQTPYQKYIAQKFGRLIRFEHLADAVKKQREIEEQKLKEEEERIKLEEYKKRIEEEEHRILTATNKGRKKKIVCHITYYTNIDNALEGGQYDKKHKLLTSHNTPLVALPKDVPYGARIKLDKAIPVPHRLEQIFTNVDTGGAIQWLDRDKIHTKVDVFIPNKSCKWIESNLKNMTVEATLYY